MPTFDQTLREMIRQELQTVVAPIAEAVAQLQQHGNLASQLTTLLGGGARRGPGRPAKSGLLGRQPATPGRKAGSPRSSASSRGCALKGCKRPARSKGYCAAHYQKRRMLEATKRLPSDWFENASPGSVKDLVLPRGRAGAKSLAEAKK